MLLKLKVPELNRIEVCHQPLSLQLLFDVLAIIVCNDEGVSAQALTIKEWFHGQCGSLWVTEDVRGRCKGMIHFASVGSDRQFTPVCCYIDMGSPLKTLMTARGHYDSNITYSLQCQY